MNSSIPTLARASLALTLALLSTGCAVPPPGATAAGLPAIPPALTGLTGFSGDPSLTGGALPTGLGGTSLAPTPPATPAPGAVAAAAVVQPEDGVDTDLDALARAQADLFEQNTRYEAEQERLRALARQADAERALMEENEAWEAAHPPQVASSATLAAYRAYTDAVAARRQAEAAVAAANAALQTGTWDGTAPDPGTAAQEADTRLTLARTAEADAWQAFYDQDRDFATAHQV